VGGLIAVVASAFLLDDYRYHKYFDKQIIAKEDASVNLVRLLKDILLRAPQTLSCRIKLKTELSKHQAVANCVKVLADVILPELGI
jgi:hypothetical protein